MKAKKVLIICSSLVMCVLAFSGCHMQDPHKLRRGCDTAAPALLPKKVPPLAPPPGAELCSHTNLPLLGKAPVRRC